MPLFLFWELKKNCFRYLATGESFASLDYCFRVGKKTIKDIWKILHPIYRVIHVPPGFRTVVAWTGRGGTIAWPLRSPDLTSLDFSVLGYVKDRVFVPPPPASLEELRARITSGCDHRCGHDSQDLGRNRLQMRHMPCDRRKAHSTPVNICR